MGIVRIAFGVGGLVCSRRGGWAAMAAARGQTRDVQFKSCNQTDVQDVCSQGRYNRKKSAVIAIPTETVLRVGLD